MNMINNGPYKKQYCMPKYTSNKRNKGQIKLIYICLQIALNLSVPMKKCNFVNDQASYEPTKRRGGRFGQTVFRFQSSHGPCLR